MQRSIMMARHAASALVLSSAVAFAQGGRGMPGGMPGGMGGMMGAAGMPGMAHDSATAAQMRDIHELVMNHDRITRTVTDLPDGIRTVTTSDDPRLAGLIKAHVVTMSQRVARGDDPGLPMESPALRAIFAGKDKIHTTIESTATGITVVQTSSDPALVSALKQHAAEVTDLVVRGRAAMHDAMMKNGRGGPPMRHPPRS